MIEPQATPPIAPDALFARGQTRIATGQLGAGLDDLRRAADRGHRAAQVEAARALLFLLAEPAGLDEAVTRLLAAEAAGDRQAPYLLASLALGGAGLSRDFALINERLNASAERGHVPAIRAVAMMLGGDEDPRAQEIAMQLFAHAAAAGDVVSARLLAERLRRGEGVAIDLTAANTLDAQLRRVWVAQLPVTAAHEFPSATAIPDRLPELSIAARLRIPQAAIINNAPRLALVDDLFSAEECRFVIAMAQPHLRRSQVLDPSLGTGGEHSIRNSSDASFDPLLEDFHLRVLQLRMARAAGCELAQGEQLIVLRYQPGERYLPHRDYFSPSALAAHRPDAGQRMTTVCVYLNPVAAGGGTEFPDLAIRVEPKPGTGLVFDNLDASGAPVPSSRHAGLSVDAGEKWLATLWLRQGRYRLF